MTRFEQLAELQKSGKNQKEIQPAKERPHYFVLRPEKSAIEFYRFLPQATRENYDECVKVFHERYSKK